MTEQLTKACPDCLSCNVSSSEERRQNESDRTWFCSDCRGYFEEPIEREPFVSGKADLSRKLQKMDPDELGTSRGST